MGWPGVEPYESAVCMGACWGNELGLDSYGGTAAEDGQNWSTEVKRRNGSPT